MSPASAAEVAKIAAELFPSPGMASRIQRLRPYICPFEALLPHVPAGSSILDIGCGAGLFLGLVAATRPGINGTGIDVSGPVIELARDMAHRLEERGCRSRLEFSQFMPEAEWPRGPFDIVSAIDVLHHVPPTSQAAFFQSLLERVRPGGALVYKDMARFPRWRAAANALHDLVMARELIHYFPIRSAESLAESAGFRLEASESMNRFWYAHEMRVFRARS